MKQNLLLLDCHTRSFGCNFIVVKIVRTPLITFCHSKKNLSVLAYIAKKEKPLYWATEICYFTNKLKANVHQKTCHRHYEATSSEVKNRCTFILRSHSKNLCTPKKFIKPLDICIFLVADYQLV